MPTQLQNQDYPLFEKWIHKELQMLDIDADTSILTDYVMALVEHDSDVEYLRKLCIDQLQEFLQNNTFIFVNNLILALTDKRYLNIDVDLDDEILLIDSKPSSTGSLKEDRLRKDLINISKNREYKTPQGQSNLSNPLKTLNQEQFSNDFRNRDGEQQEQVGFGGGAQSAMAAAAIFPSVKTEHHDDHIFSMTNGSSQFVAATQTPFRGQQYKKGSMHYQALFSVATTQADYEFVNKKLVVENIPDEKFSKPSIIGHFLKFGQIVNVELDDEFHLAEIEFCTHMAARQAWSSPIPFFNNRFVKVYWRKTDASTSVTDNGLVDITAAVAFQQQKQQEWNNKKERRRDNAEKIRDTLQRQVLLVGEMKKQQEKLLRSAERVGDADNVGENPTVTQDLQTQLQALKREATLLGLTGPNTTNPSRSAFGGVRGGYQSGFRNRGRFSGRGGYGSDHYYGSPYTHFAKIPPWRRPDAMRYIHRVTSIEAQRAGGIQLIQREKSNGGFHSAVRSHYRLDLRSRSVEVSPVPAGKEGPVRTYVLSIGKYEDLRRSTTAPDTFIITFKDRTTAERFFYSVLDIPGIGSVKKVWAKP
jgi:hypothetical protein